MARSKTRTTIAGVALALMGVGAAICIVNALYPMPDIQGAWEGMLYLPGNGVHRWESPKTPLVLRIARVNGVYRASLDNIGLGEQLQLATFAYTYPDLHGEIALTNGDSSLFDGKINRFGDKMTWQYRAKSYAYTIICPGIMMSCSSSR